MNNYNINQTSGTTVAGLGLGALFMLQLVNYGMHCQQPDVSQLVQTPIKIEESSKTYGQHSNIFTGEYEDISLNFEEDVASFYAQLLATQEPLGKEFEQVLYDNLWDLLVHT
ncbi:MAG: hypothetical protein ABFD08_07815 [Syntrophomonas sp.]